MNVLVIAAVAITVIGMVTTLAATIVVEEPTMVTATAIIELLVANGTAKPTSITDSDSTIVT